MKIVGCSVIVKDPVMGHGGLEGWTARCIGIDVRTIEEVCAFMLGVYKSCHNGSHVDTVEVHYEPVPLSTRS